jgi:hypothetical protein
VGVFAELEEVAVVVIGAPLDADQRLVDFVGLGVGDDHPQMSRHSSTRSMMSSPALVARAPHRGVAPRARRLNGHQADQPVPVRDLASGRGRRRFHPVRRALQLVLGHDARDLPDPALLQPDLLRGR